MRDLTVTILHILSAASRLGGSPVGRTVLVKQIYLVELLRPSYELYTRAYDFFRYRHGPYSAEIFQRLDHLIFHGLVRVKDFGINGNRVQATYVATESGISASSTMTFNDRGRHLATLCQDVVWSLQCLGVRGYSDIVRLVYSEPAFDEVKTRAIREGLSDTAAVGLPDPQSPEHPSFRIQLLFRAIRRSRDTSLPAPREIVRRYLQYLTVVRSSLDHKLEESRGRS